MSTSGTVVSVTQTTLGSVLAADATLGDSTVTVNDSSDFDEISGGTLSIGGVQYGYTLDAATDTLTLAATLAANASDGDRVDVWDTALAEAATETRAQVALPGALANDDTIDATVAHSLVPLLDLGIRDPGTGESVTMEERGDEWTVVDVRGRRAKFSSTFTPMDRLSVGVTYLAAALTGTTKHVAAWDSTADSSGTAIRLNSPDDGGLYLFAPGMYAITTTLKVDGIRTAAGTWSMVVLTGAVDFPNVAACSARGGDAAIDQWAASSSQTYYSPGAGLSSGISVDLDYTTIDPAIVSVAVHVDVALVSS